jgi:hypothetical protein
MKEAMKVNLPYVIPDTDRHGNVRYYFRRPGQPKIRILGDPTSQAFIEQYYLVRDGKVAPKQAKPRLERSASGTFRRLCEEYYVSSEFGQLGKSTAHVRRLILEGICQSKNPKGKERGGLPFALMQERHIRERGTKRQAPPKPRIAASKPCVSCSPGRRPPGGSARTRRWRSNA